MDRSNDWQILGQSRCQVHLVLLLIAQDFTHLGG
jgi:hypothetical protein